MENKENELKCQEDCKYRKGFFCMLDEEEGHCIRNAKDFYTPRKEKI